jgi:hypothetical protein
VLNGIDPIIIFQFAKNVDPKFTGPIEPSTGQKIIASIPLISSIPTLVEAPPIPIYLSEQITGLVIASESKSIDMQTDVETKSDASTPDVNQKGINETVKINIKGNKNSLGLTLLTTMASLILDRVTAKEYAISYLHGAITVFRGVLHSFSVDQDSNSDLIFITIELAKGAKTPQKPSDIPVVGREVGALPLAGGA